MLGRLTFQVEDVHSASMDGGEIPACVMMFHPLHHPQREGLAPHCPGLSMSTALWARGCHHSLGKPKGSSSLAPLGREEARLVVSQGTSALPLGWPSPH